MRNDEACHMPFLWEDYGVPFGSRQISVLQAAANSKYTTFVKKRAKYGGLELP